MNNKARQITTHVLGCIIFLAFPVIFSPDLSSSFHFLKMDGFQRDFFSSALMLLFFYLNYLVLIPRFYFNKKYVTFFFCVLLCYLLIAFLPSLIDHDHLHTFQHECKYTHAPDGFPPPGESFFMHEFQMRYLQFLIVFSFSLMISINNKWKQTEKEKTTAELAYLKAQINPHFLFNTLNSIYSLAIVKSDTVASAIVKLSNMMRYVLSESTNDFVSLEKEIEYIQNYIELQQIRFGSFINLSCSISGDAKNKEIAPLILIPFIENAYKHGINAEENSMIKISIDIAQNELHLSVINNKVFVQRSEELKSGLGVENTKNRLQLLYPGKHILIINDNEKEYIVSLTLNLV